jgi:hypothetical protein
LEQLWSRKRATPADVQPLHLHKALGRLLGRLTIGALDISESPAPASLAPVMWLAANSAPQPAAEVRKRLIQYYYSRDHSGELVIELPVGSYVPCFREPATPETVIAAERPPAEKIEASSRGDVEPAVPPADSERAPSRFSLRHWILIGTGLFIAAFIGFGVGRVEFPNQPSNLERFWGPFTAASNRVTYCLGEPTPSDDRQRAAAERTLPKGSLNLSDVITLARSIIPPVPRNGAFRVVAARDTELTQLREGPSVLIGAFDNPWTMRITRDLPFGLEADDQVLKIVDRKSAKSRFWTLQWQVPYTELARDYAIVARIRDSVTGQPVIILAGLFGGGTPAASEVVSNPAYLNALLGRAPKNRDQLNLEAVIETRLIEGHPGPPTVIAVETW